MTKIFKNIEDERSQSLLVLGTENQELIVLDKSGISVNKNIKL
jgi:hypothetical protein